MEPKSLSKLKFSINGFTRQKKVLKICIAVVVLILLILVGLHYGFESWKAHDVVRDDNDCYYTVVVDCGSTGTRVNVYKWRARNLGATDLPILVHSYPDDSTEKHSKKSCNYHCMQTEPGLDKFVGNLSGVRESLEPLIRRAESWVPLKRHRDSPIFILATAGLRKLSPEDSSLILDDVEEVVKQHSFVYRRSWIRVLSGKEEAYYGWVALNYKMESLGDSSGRATLGVLDLGGSSLQIVMETNDNAIRDANLIRSKIGLLEHQILAYSLPSFGLNEAFDRTVGMLSQAQLIEDTTNEKHKIRHPCLSSDILQNYTCHVCDELQISYQNLSSQMPRSPDVSLRGEPNWELCRQIANAAAINTSSSDWLQPTVGTNCKASSPSHSGNGILNFSAGTNLPEHFHALSGFFVVYNQLNLFSTVNLTKIQEKGQQLCSQLWDVSSSNSENHYYSGQYCFQVPYMASLIENALCLSDREITFGPGDLSWTLGAALVEGDYLWLNTTDQTGISSMKSMKFLYSPIFVFLILLSLFLIVYTAQIKLPMLGRKVSTIKPVLPPFTYFKQRPN